MPEVVDGMAMSAGQGWPQPAQGAGRTGLGNPRRSVFNKTPGFVKIGAWGNPSCVFNKTLGFVKIEAWGNPSCVFLQNLRFC